ncbi:hypothetical protein [Acidisoma cladoniae]|jgi:hypothetical protein|uniref:hypothetical protein n=1 Tax=Acidisoma cladoniae TaxID=3040935 RepID=UPI0025501E25|nr:hypothetical protein [Acidisoma sp. PAMC 29798]
MNQAEARDRGHLPPAESVLLLAIRVEVEGLRTGVDRRSHVRAILDMLACPNADRALLDFIGSLAAPGAAARALAISGVSSPVITPDERLLIDVIALQQQGRSLESMIMLRAIWLDDVAVLSIQETAGRLAVLLRRAGQQLLAPEDQTRLSAWSGGHGQDEIGLMASAPQSATPPNW